MPVCSDDPEAIPDELEEVAREVCKACAGAPLTLKVVGGATAGKVDVDEWRSTLRHLKNPSLNTLRISFDGLDDVTKKCFLYFAAFPTLFLQNHIHDELARLIGIDLVGRVRAGAKYIFTVPELLAKADATGLPVILIDGDVTSSKVDRNWPLRVSYLAMAGFGVLGIFLLVGNLLPAPVVPCPLE